MSADEVLTRLEQIATGTMDDFIYPSGAGVKLDLVKAKKAGKLHLLKSYSKGKQGTKIELYSAHDALRDLGKYHSLFIDRDDDGKPITPITTIEIVLPPEPEDSGNGN